MMELSTTWVRKWRTTIEEVADSLPFPIKITVTCDAGVLLTSTIAYPGAEPAFAIDNSVEPEFPITMTCSGSNGDQVSATINQPPPLPGGTA